MQVNITAKGARSKHLAIGRVSHSAHHSNRDAPNTFERLCIVDEDAKVSCNRKVRVVDGESKVARRCGKFLLV